ncbi:MAG: EAL domain-containing protein [Pseudomonadota bacterium]
MNSPLKRIKYSTIEEKIISNIEFLPQVIDSLEESIIVLDTNKNVLFINSAFQNKLKEANKSQANIHSCEKLLDELYMPCHGNNNLCPFEEISRTKKPIKTIHQFMDKNDLKQHIELSITPLYDKNNNIYGYVECRRDISEHIKLNETLKEKEKELYDLAHQDTLTGLPNRRLFLSHLKKVINTTKKSNALLALLFIDLDNFKKINDTLGHQIGDEVLKIAAKRLKGMVRENDIVCRLGGDEFVILIEMLIEPETAGLLAQNIINNQSQKIKLRQHELCIKSSIGISIYPNDAIDAEELLQSADIAMYKAKQLGRNTYSFYTQELKNNAIKQMLLEKELNQAISKKQLLIYYQPQINLETGQLTGMEALIRWQHPSKGLLPPDKFIPIAEQSCLIEDIGEWILETVCNQIVLWKKAGETPGRIAVNLASRQILNSNLVKKIKTLLEKSQCPANSLEFKITEGFLPHLTDESLETLNALREMGIELSIDDFGKGYASLAFLKRLPITRLKIDRSFIQNNGDEPPDEDIARAIIALGESLHIKVIAEGVEQKEQQNLLSRIGCKEAQGYLFGHPMNSKNMTIFLDKELGKSWLKNS